MSASNKKKLRREQTAALLTEKQQQEQKEAKKLKVMTTTFIVVMALVLAIVVGVMATPTVTGIVRRNSHAVTIGDHELSAAELSYFYIDSILDYRYNIYQNYYAYYGEYWYLGLGFDTTTPLDKQTYDEKTGETWAEYFVNASVENATSIYSLYDDAMAKGYTLSEEDQKALDDSLNHLKEDAKENNFNSVAAYLRSVYGDSATVKSFKEYYTISTIATSYYADHSDELEDSYTVEDFRAYDKDKFNNYSSFSYVYYTLSYSSYLKTEEGTKNESGQTDWTEEQKNVARDKAKADAEALLAAGITDKASFDKAVQELEINKYDSEGKPVEDSKKATATEANDRLYTSISISDTAKEWLAHADRKAGDVASIPVYAYITKDGETVAEDHVHGDDCGHDRVANSYYVILFVEKDTNETYLANVRHILVNFEGGTKDSSGKVTYSVAEKEAAKAEAEKILADWKASIANETDAAKIEESFGALANEKSDDQNGKVTNGGLYEDIYPGQMTANFNDWCFDAARKAGDTGIVETEYGYHVMFYSSTDELTYRDMMVSNEMLTEDMKEWSEGLAEAKKAVIVNLKHMEYDLILG